MYLITKSLIVLKFGNYNRESTDADFDRDLVVEGVNLELQSLSSLLKNFERSSIMYLMTKSLNTLQSALNLDQSRQVQSRKSKR